MRFRRFLNEKGAVYPAVLVFFLAAAALIVHSSAMAAVQYRTNDSLENAYRRATILLLEQAEINTVTQEQESSGWSDETHLLNRIYGERKKRGREEAELPFKASFL
ncbi:hypothetical protein [Indiicoccus explosivorum]|uniref:hypothetical protein n=1 Tax=Indiicoccus explosivorum TaxID=1917864 RepID=UPI0013904735|nr:hypothetical protein [Indiicoccus explosivorum]